jgi:ABC-type molybdate transport system substrate-binding protein
MNRTGIHKFGRNVGGTWQLRRAGGEGFGPGLHVMQRLLFLGSALLAMAVGVPERGLAQTPCSANAQQLIIYHAGSLSTAFTAVEQLLTTETGICITDVAAGSVDAARRITAGAEPCDIFASADYLDIDLFLKPAGYASYNLLFGQGSMVLAYTTVSKGADKITKPLQEFAPPSPIPEVATDWYDQLRKSGVWIGGSHPFLDPSGYRADMIFQLAETVYDVPNLYDSLLQHYSIIKSTDVLGQTYDYSFTYEHSALAAYKANPGTYRYARLPALVDLSRPRLNPKYAAAVITVPGLRTPTSAPTVEIDASRVVWGLTILKSASNAENAIRFLDLLFSDRGVALQKAAGPAPISPPQVSASDVSALPQSLRSMVSVVQ